MVEEEGSYKWIRDDQKMFRPVDVGGLRKTRLINVDSLRQSHFLVGDGLCNSNFWLSNLVFSLLVEYFLNSSTLNFYEPLKADFLVRLLEAFTKSTTIEGLPRD